MAKRKKSSKKFTNVDPAYLDKQRASLRRIHRKSVLFNAQELAAIDTYCKRFKVAGVVVTAAVYKRIVGDFYNIALFRFKFLLKKNRQINLAHKAYTLRIFAFGACKIGFGGYSPNFGFNNIANGKEHVF